MFDLTQNPAPSWWQVHYKVETPTETLDEQKLVKAQSALFAVSFIQGLLALRYLKFVLKPYLIRQTDAEGNPLTDCETLKFNQVAFQ